VSAQVLEHAPRQADGGRRQRYGVGANARFGTYAFRGGEGGLKQLVENGAGAAAFLGDSVGVFQLPEDLRLAQDHGIKPGGHAKSMFDRARFLMDIKTGARSRLFP